MSSSISPAACSNCASSSSSLISSSSSSGCEETCRLLLLAGAVPFDLRPFTPDLRRFVCVSLSEPAALPCAAALPIGVPSPVFHGLCATSASPQRRTVDARRALYAFRASPRQPRQTMSMQPHTTRIIRTSHPVQAPRLAQFTLCRILVALFNKGVEVDFEFDERTGREGINVALSVA